MGAKQTNRRQMLIASLSLAGLFGCGENIGDSIARIYGGGGDGGGGGGGGNPNTGGEPDAPGTERLQAITFSPDSNFPQGADSVELDVDLGTVDFDGGAAGSLGLPGLYADDAFAWDVFADASATITFRDLDVIAIDGYWVHPDDQANGATMTVTFSDGSSLEVDSAPINAMASPGQADGFFDTVDAPEGETIVELGFEFGADADAESVSALDRLELTVRVD